MSRARQPRAETIPMSRRLAPAHMAAGLHALGDEGLGAGVLGVQRVLQRAHLVHHGDAGGAQPRDQGPVHVPEQADHGHAERNAQIHLALQQRGGRAGGDEVDAKRLAGACAQLGHLALDERQRLAHHAQEAKAAGLGDRGHQLMARDAAHAGQQQRQAAAQQLAQWGGAEGGWHGISCWRLTGRP